MPSDIVRRHLSLTETLSCVQGTRSEPLRHVWVTIRSQNHTFFSPLSSNLRLFGKNKVKKPNCLGFSLKSFIKPPLLECTCKQKQGKPEENQHVRICPVQKELQKRAGRAVCYAHKTQNCCFFEVLRLYYKQ